MDSFSKFEAQENSGDDPSMIELGREIFKDAECLLKQYVALGKCELKNTFAIAGTILILSACTFLFLVVGLVALMIALANALVVYVPMTIATSFAVASLLFLLPAFFFFIATRFELKNLADGEHVSKITGKIPKEDNGWIRQKALQFLRLN